MPEIYPRLLVGLGNPGVDYEETRHNIGFMVVDHFISHISSSSLQSYRTSDSEFWSFRRKGMEVVIQKPLTYMNLSGDAVLRLSQKKRILPNEILVIYDDIDLPLGKIRLRCKGSSGGHQGIASIITALKTDNISRLRVGVGRGNNGDDGVINHVLSPFLVTELNLVTKVIDVAIQAITVAVNRGVEKSMSIYNGLTVGVENHNN